jgi:two-component system phosphate regulon sensor histidine kinase PhoR
MNIFLKTLSLILLPIIIVFSASYFFIQKDIDASFKSYIKNDTKSKFQIIQHDFEKNSIDKKRLYKIYSKIYKNTLLRITLIQNNGKVIFDSSIKFKRINKLENHKYRPEVQETLEKGSGFSSRFSKTKQMYMMYFAKKLKNGNILRISYPLTYIESLKNHFDKGLYEVFLSTLAILIVISVLIARRLSLPIQKLNYIVDAIKEKKQIHFPRFRDENLSKVSMLIYDIYKAMENKQMEVEIEKEKLNYILEFMEEGVLLLDEDFNCIHLNIKFSKMFNINISTGENIFKAVEKDAELLAAFDNIINKKTKMTLKIKGRIYQIYYKTIGNYMLFVFNDIEEKAQYEYFKSELVGNISHELKTPIASIMGYTETLLINNDLDDETKNDFLKKIYDGSIRLNELLNDIIELHGLENLSIDKIDEQVDLNEFERKIENIYEKSGKKLHIDFKIDSIAIFKEHLMSITTNLIDNAVKYSSGKNVYMVIEKKDGHIFIYVDDEGPKIPQSEQERIFERFYTCSKSRNKQKSGTGLGLSIVKHIIKLYRGNITLKENPYGGNRFKIKL